MPPETTFDTEEPETTPFSADDSTATLAGPPAEVAEQRGRDLHHVVAGARDVEQRAEEHEQEDELDRDAERHAVDALGGEPHVRDHARQARALVLDHLGHVRAGEDVGEEDAGRDQHGGAHGPPRGLEHDRDPDQPHHHVQRGRLARPQGELVVEDIEIRAAERPYGGEHPVCPRYPLARRRLERRERHERQEDRQREVDRAGLGVVEDAEPQDERERRGVPDLEDRPATGQESEERSDPPARVAAADVRFLDELIQLVAGVRLRRLGLHPPSSSETGGRQVPSARPQGAPTGAGPSASAYLSQPFSR